MKIAASDSSLSTSRLYQTIPNNDGHDHIAPYMTLGRAVIERALFDLTSNQANGRPAKTSRKSAERFLLGPNECAYWCWVGEIERALVVAKAREIIAKRDGGNHG